MKPTFFKTALIILLACLSAVSMPVYAENKALNALLQVMQENGQLSKEQYDMIMAVAQEDEQQSVAETNANTNANIRAIAQEEIVQKEMQAIAKQETKPPVNISTKGKLQFESADKDFKFRIGGRIMLDGAIYDEDKTPLGSQAEVRRARLYMSGTLWRAWQFKTQFDFAGNKTGIRDLYVKYTGFKPVGITVGNFKEPFSLEGSTSSRYTTFIERAMQDIFTPTRNMGIGVNTNGSNWSAAAGLFADGVDDTEPEGLDESYALTGRLTYAPILEGANVLHLGASASYREMHNGNDSLRLAARPEAHTSDQKLIDTGTMTDVDSLNGYNVEAAWVHGPLSIQGQYVMMDISRDNGFDDLDFDGYYVEGSWFLTGENRVYNHKKGVFDYPKVKSIAGMGGTGAWQIALRFSSLDLTDGSVIGGEEQNITAGLNWYATPNMRFMANYTQVIDLDRPGDIHDGDEPGVFQVRAQVHW